MTFLHGGANLPRIGDYNQRVVLECIRRRAADVSRTELSELTGLSLQTVSNVTRRLIDTGLIRETGHAIVGPGKPRTLLRLSSGSGFAVGVHLDPLVIDVVVVDVTGAVVARGGGATPIAGSPRHVLAAIASSVKQILRKAGVDFERVVGVGVAVPGPVDHRRGVVVDPPLLHGWRDVAVASDLAHRLALPVTLEKDVIAATVGESWVRNDGDPSSFIYFYLGTGVGMGAVLGGTVLRGVSSNFGEIGHLVVDHDGPRCSRCDRVGELGALLERANVVAEGVAAGIVSPPATDSVADVDGVFRLIWQAATDGDRRAADVADRIVRRLGVGVARATDLLDIREVVFGGPYWPLMTDRVLTAMPTILATESVLSSVGPVVLKGSRFSDDVGSMGAAALVLDEALSARPDRLVHQR